MNIDIYSVVLKVISLVCMKVCSSGEEEHLVKEKGKERNQFHAENTVEKTLVLEEDDVKDTLKKESQWEGKEEDKYQHDSNTHDSNNNTNKNKRNKYSKNPNNGFIVPIEIDTHFQKYGKHMWDVDYKERCPLCEKKIDEFGYCACNSYSD